MMQLDGKYWTYLRTYDSTQSYRTRSKLVLTDSYERNIADTDSMYVKIISLLTSSVFYKVMFFHAAELKLEP